jgi:hypothetical protein
MAVSFNINRVNCLIIYNVLRRVLFKRYKTNLIIYLYIIILLPFKRDSSSLLIDLSIILIKIKRLVEFVFVIFIRSKSFYINIDYIIRIVKSRILNFIVL